jgi:hypothetical protein
MFQTPAAIASTHETARFWLDVADKLIKLAAVLIGGLWTWWNYHKSRTYEQKLELEIDGSVFIRHDLYGDIKVTVKNIGATKHEVQHTGTFCILSTIDADLTEHDIQILPIFMTRTRIEPGELIDDTLCWRIAEPVENALWIKLRLRLISNGVEWHTSDLIRVDGFLAAGR